MNHLAICFKMKHCCGHRWISPVWVYENNCGWKWFVFSFSFFFGRYFGHQVSSKCDAIDERNVIQSIFDGLKWVLTWISLKCEREIQFSTGWICWAHVQGPINLHNFWLTVEVIENANFHHFLYSLIFFSLFFQWSKMYQF